MSPHPQIDFAIDRDFTSVQVVINSGEQSVVIDIPKDAGRYGYPSVRRGANGKFIGTWVDCGDDPSARIPD